MVKRKVGGGGGRLKKKNIKNWGENPNFIGP